MNTHNICFRGEIYNFFYLLFLLSGAMQQVVNGLVQILGELLQGAEASEYSRLIWYK